MRTGIVANLRRFIRPAVIAAVIGGVVAQAQTTSLSTSAFRVFGQPDLRQNGLNHTVGAELWAPNGIALDATSGTLAVYVADSRNNRVLAWRDAKKYTNGDTADFVLGQPDL